MAGDTALHGRAGEERASGMLISYAATERYEAEVVWRVQEQGRRVGDVPRPGFVRRGDVTGGRATCGAEGGLTGWVDESLARVGGPHGGGAPRQGYAVFEVQPQGRASAMSTSLALTGHQARAVVRPEPRNGPSGGGQLHQGHAPPAAETAETGIVTSTFCATREQRG